MQRHGEAGVFQSLGVGNEPHVRRRVRRLGRIARSEGAAEALRQTWFYLRRRRPTRRWKADGGHYGTRFDYDVSEDDVIFDVGGFDGNYTADFLDRHDPGAVHVFEPVSRFQAEIANRFADDDRVVLHEYGLGGRTRVEEMAVGGSASSLYRCNMDRTEDVFVRDVTEVVDELGCEDVKLLKINAEGAEYEILERLVEAEYVDRFENVQVSFHCVVEDPLGKRNSIQERLGETHELNFSYDFVMEEWTRKADVAGRVEARRVEGGAVTSTDERRAEPVRRRDR